MNTEYDWEIEQREMYRRAVITEAEKIIEAEQFARDVAARVRSLRGCYEFKLGPLTVCFEKGSK